MPLPIGQTTAPNPVPVPEGGRVQLALRVSNLETAITFYSGLFGVAPTKTKPGYANFAIPAPPLKLVLIEGSNGGQIDHLGIEVPTTEAVAAASKRLSSTGLVTLEETETACCYAVQDKVWVSGPDAERWEVYTVLSDSEEFKASKTDDEKKGATMNNDPCCTDDSCCS